MNLKERIRELRKQLGLTQKELGEKLGAAESTISHYETGLRAPDHTTLQDLARIFGVTTDYLLGYKNTLAEKTDEPTDTELEDFLYSSNIKFDGAPLDEEDKEAIIGFLRMVWKKKRKK